ncbi:MAG: DUF3343 domain-containing protein [Syntrophobacterales bacterium]|nr:DUF3343 domain-containing protein [Syntrophobacterales bacterium]
MLIFENTSEVIKVEKVLRSSGYSVKVMGPPPEFRKGCDLVIVFPILMQPDVTRCLKKNGIEPL